MMPRRLRCCCVGMWSWGCRLAGRRLRRWTSLLTTRAVRPSRSALTMATRWYRSSRPGSGWRSTGRHQRRGISRRSDDNDRWMKTGSGRSGGASSTAARGLGGGGAGGRGRAGVAAGAPCTTSNTGSTPPRRLGDSTMLGAPPPFSTPAQRRRQCASGAAGAAGYAVFPPPSPRPGPYRTIYVQCE